MADDPTTLTVNYTVKELLTQIQNSVNKIDAKLDTKASVESLDILEQRVTVLELSRAKLVGAMAAVALLSGTGGAFVSQMVAGV